MKPKESKVQKPKPAKATKAEVAQRIEEVLQIRLDGAEFHDVLQYASEKQWNVGERQLWHYIKASDVRLVKRLEKDRGRLLARHIAQRRSLYARALNAADYRTCLAVAKDEAELQGLYPKPEDELRREVEELKKLLTAAEPNDDNGNAEGGNRPAKAASAGADDKEDAAPVAG